MKKDTGDVNRALGTELMVLRARHRLSQGQLSTVLEPFIGRKVHPSTISQWENGATPITVDLLGAYAAAFELGIGDIIRSAGLDKPVTRDGGLECQPAA